MRWEASGRTGAVLLFTAFRICSKQQAVSLYNFHQAFCPGVSFESLWCNYTVVLAWPQLGRPCFTYACIDIFSRRWDIVIDREISKTLSIWLTQTNTNLDFDLNTWKELLKKKDDQVCLSSKSLHQNESRQRGGWMTKPTGDTMNKQINNHRRRTSFWSV